MCGIAGIHRRGDARIPKLERLADTLLCAIENRGRDATGLLAMLPDGKVHFHREVVPATRFVEKRKRLRGDVRTLLLHTRFATVGRRDDVRNAHPVLNSGMAAVHNGTIYNHNAIFRAFNLKRHAEVDSEVIPALIAEAGWENAAEAIDLFEGGAAFAVVDEKHPNELILGRTESYPLHYLVTDRLVVWASTREAIERAWAMTFGSRKPRGEWFVMPEWTMVRINGTMETTTIRKPKPRPIFTRPKKSAPPRRKRSAGTTTAPRSVPRTTSTATSRQLPIYEPHREREPWMEEAVHDLMRIEGYSYAEAFDAVYGVSVADDDEAWIEAFLADGRAWS